MPFVFDLEGLTSPIALTELQVHDKKVKKNVDRK